MFMRCFPRHGISAFFLSLALGFFTVLAADTSLDRHLDRHSVPPTFSSDVHAKVHNGGETVIVLKAIPSFGSQIQFEIVSTPQYGTLSELKSSSDHTAVVSYSHTGSRVSSTDRFTFRCKAPGHTKSIPYSVQIEVIPAPPSLVLQPREVNFGPFRLGDKQQTNIVLINQGQQRAAGRLVLPKGFDAPEGDGFSLAGGERTTVPLEFNPMEEREYSGQVAVLPSFQATSLMLKGSGEARFEATMTDPLTCHLKNLSNQPLHLTFSGDSSLWKMPPETILPPHAETQFSFEETELEEGVTPAPVASKFSVSDGLSTRFFELPPHRASIPLTVRATSPLSIGKVPVGVASSVSVSVFNRSQEKKTARWSYGSSHGGGSIASTPVEFNGGESKDIRFDWTPTLPGDAQLVFLLEEGVRIRHEISFTATVVPDGSQDRVSESGPDLSMAGPPAEDAPKQNEVPSTTATREVTVLPPVQGGSWSIKQSLFGIRVLLQWDDCGDAGSRFMVEERVVRIHDMNRTAQGGRAFFGGVPCTVESMPLDFKNLGNRNGKMVADLQKLHPGWHSLLLSELTSGGVMKAQSPLKLFVPPAPSFWSTWGTLLGVLSIILLLLFLRALRG